MLSTKEKAVMFMERFKKSHKLNGLLANTLLEESEEEKPLTPNKSWMNPTNTNGLFMCNALYLYTNPPPVGYGTPAPKTAETVLRAYSYNRKTEDKSYKIKNWDIENTKINDLETFPFDEISGNFHDRYATTMARDYLVQYYRPIIDSCISTMDWFLTSKADEMSKGRQTWDPESEKSITCAKAYCRTMELIETNLNEVPTSFYEIMQCFFKLCEKDSLKIKKRVVVETKKKIYVPAKFQRVFVTKKRIKIKDDMVIGKDNVFNYMVNYARSFCSYIKHKERGKKDRRAIASANVFLRMFLKVIEEFHLKLSKKVKGNTIGIGGDEKKRKIITELKTDTELIMPGQYLKIQGTEDATKWNECLNPSLFALVHYVFFSDEFRKSCPNLPKVTEHEKIFLKICDITFLLMSIKKIHLGVGVQIVSETSYIRKNWPEYKREELNNETLKWYDNVKFADGNYIEASPGFLMGMLNAASTTIGLLPSNFIKAAGMKVTTLRSSDDSMSVYSGLTPDHVVNAVSLNYYYCKLIGINMSTKKTIFFNESFGEYTSWYQDGDFVGQTGTETSSMRPDGINPQEDFNNLAIKTAILMRTQIINVMGAHARMFLGINNIRSLYHIQLKEREGISNDVLFLADGGDNPWDLENLIIDEATIRASLRKTEDDYAYIYKIMSPLNPFIGPPEEQYMYSREAGSIVKSSYELPLSIFNFVKRSNRTIQNQTSNLEAEMEKHNKIAYKICITAEPGLLIKTGNRKTKVADFISSLMYLKMNSLTNLTVGDRNLIKRAAARLRDADMETYTGEERESIISEETANIDMESILN